YDKDDRRGISGSPDAIAIVISGTVDADHNIKATCTFPNTDASPFQLRGRYTMRDDLQMWGTKRKIVTHKEIVFTHPPNREFFGFLGRDVRDEESGLRP